MENAQFSWLSLEKGCKEDFYLRVFMFFLSRLQKKMGRGKNQRVEIVRYELFAQNFVFFCVFGTCVFLRSGPEPAILL